MESSWHMKCDSTFQPSTPAMVSSASQEPMRQMEANSGHSLYPRTAHSLRSKFVRGMQDPDYNRFPWITNHGSTLADAGNSFLALLSGPSSLLQSEFQQLSDQKPCASSGNFPASSGNFVVDSVGSGTFLTSSKGLITENLSNHNMQTRGDTFPAITSREMGGPSSGINFVFSDIWRADTAVHPSVPGSEKAREPLSFTGQCCGTTHVSNLNICSSDIQAMPNMALEGSSSKMATPFMSGCPRVFCMGKSGYLLLSNTGLLGIVCSCHCCHMSVLKFCEHSGLHDVNPGDAIRMESGETIAQWRKFYFLKFGIRSPGNESEWDWPEVLSISATASLMKSNATNSNMSKSDLSHLCNSPAASLRPGKPYDNVMFPKDAHTDHHLFIGALSNKQQITIHDGCNKPIKGFTGISRSDLRDRTNSQLMATSSTTPNFVGNQRDDGSQLLPACLDSLKRNENVSLAHSPSQNPISLLKDLDFSINKDTNEGLIGRDTASSNIELRLGQLPLSGNPALSVIGPQEFDTLVSPPKLQYLKQMTHNSAESPRRKEELWNNFCGAACPSNSIMVEEQSQLKLRNYMSGVGNGLGTARARSETENVANGFKFLPYSLFNSQYQGNTKANENLVNDGELIMSKILHSGSNTIQFGPTDVLWKSNDHIERRLNKSSLGSHKFLDNDRGVGCAKESHAKFDSGPGISKLVEHPYFLTRAVGGSSDSSIPALNGKISRCEPSMMLDASVGMNFSCGSKKVSSVGQDNHVTLRSMGSQTASGIAKLSEGILMGFPFLVSSSTSNQTPTLLEQEGVNTDTYLLDENMRLLALTQILELSKQQHARYLHEISQKQGRSSNVSNVQHSIYEASTSKQGTSEVTLKSPLKKGTCGNHGITGDLEKLASFTGLNRCCSLSALAPTPLHSKEKELQCRHSCDLRNDEPSLSLGISKGVTRSSECEICSEQPSDTHLIDKYNCAAQANCLGNNFILGAGPSPYTFRQQLANASGENSLIIASNFTKDQNASKHENIQFQQGAKFDAQNPSKIGSCTPQWRDVPSKVRKGVCDAGSLDQPAVILDCEGQGGEQLGNLPSKRLKRTIFVEDYLKEQASSNVSSECSAPVVIHSSVEVNNVDSSTVDAVDNQYFDNLVVDEGSGIEKGWSSDALESDRSAEFLGSTCETYLKKAYLRVLNDQPCRSLLDELKLLDSLTWKKGQDQNHVMLSSNCKTNQSPKVKRGFKGKKRKRMEVRMLDALVPSGIPSLSHNENDESTGVADFPSNLSKEMQMYFACNRQKSKTRTSFVQSSTKQRTFSSKFLSCKSHLSKHHNDRDGHNSCEESNYDAEFHKFTEVSGRKKLRKDIPSESFRQFQKQEPACEESENPKPKSFYCRQENAFRNTRPVVCGKYGEITTEKLTGEVPKPAKIVSLSKVLKTSKKCRVPTNGKTRITSKKKWKNLSLGTSNRHCFLHSGLKTKEVNGTVNAIVCDETNVDVSKEDLKMSKKSIVVCKVQRDAKAKQGGSIIDRIHAPLKLKSKEIRKRSIYELTAKETKVKKIMEYAEDRKHDLCNSISKMSVQEHRGASILDSDAFCCVCRSSSNDEINCLLECSRCLIRVHQACYGISTLPKGRWCCRPCRTNSKDIACVLCGYGGGAMTRALRSHTIVKSLLKVWNIEKEGMPKHTTLHESFEKEMGSFHSTKSELEGDQKFVSRPENFETLTTDLGKVETSTNHMQHTPYSNGNFNVSNSITAGVLDTTVKQWVHMVCGLWTPGTRCPNVDTMSAFDVSGVSRPKADMVCSICNRSGGSCIECRVVGCSVKFHPWCAHQKNLLQSETEGDDDEKVGFYGRCVLHANDPVCESKHDLVGSEMGCLEEIESICARTRGYKGRRRDGFQHNYYGVLKGKGGCLVPQEQLNAWIHINGQKCSQGLPKFPVSDVEYDCRKEYVRYKQAKGWKHLVVYKSGIHALGLYTSRFISRGEMVVEYVGEIVGLRVADKRENEYQSGRKLQYKSACYFFRIDKEHIIDATRKGGIARFVNHSCLPNCVAKVITIRHEKKVVFFAERDIFPGEEITYDYHFNHEDEGQKIPCYCNSKNCRRYLN